MMAYATFRTLFWYLNPVMMCVHTFTIGYLAQILHHLKSLYSWFKRIFMRFVEKISFYASLHVCCIVHTEYRWNSLRLSIRLPYGKQNHFFFLLMFSRRKNEWFKQLWPQQNRAHRPNVQSVCVCRIVVRYIMKIC